MIARGLRRRVRAVRLVKAMLCERRIIGVQGAKDLIGGYIDETKLLPLFRRQCFPGTPDRVQQSKSPGYIRANEIFWPMDRAVDVALCRYRCSKSFTRSVSQISPFTK